MKFAYADPPYIGQARKHYAKHPDFAGEVDHEALIARLVAEFPDGWALSLSSSTLQTILAMCPPRVRVMAWVKPMTPMLPGVRLQYGWEPVILSGGRQGHHVTGNPMVRDWLSQNPFDVMFGRIKPGHVIGRKPVAFCRWLFDALGAQPEDELVDLFPGTGAVGKAWDQFRTQIRWTA